MHKITIQGTIACTIVKQLDVERCDFALVWKDASRHEYRKAITYSLPRKCSINAQIEYCQNLYDTKIEFHILALLWRFRQ